MLKFIAHRGLWRTKEERNSLEAIETAIQNGYGFETDIRDYKGALVVSHDIANDNSPLIDEVLKKLSKYKTDVSFAINIKADGIAYMLKGLLEKYEVNNYFVFDMSVPQMIEYRDLGLNFYTRQSEIEIEPHLYETASGVWIDAFNEIGWITEELILNHLSNNKKVCIVSPELHSNEYMRFWEVLREYKIESEDVYLCTDYVMTAKEFFYEN